MPVAKQRKIWRIMIYCDHYMSISKDLYLGRSLFDAGGCLECNCDVTLKSNDTDAADVIVFPWNCLAYNANPPTKSPGQIWVFYTLETPATTAALHLNVDRYKRFNGMFNWTMTYRSDSDIPMPYGYISRRHSSSDSFSEQEIIKLKRKPRLAAWFVSNCNTIPSKRLTLVNELSKYIDIDVYGKCGKYRCPRSDESKCVDILATKYKFYFSFENSICKDYITEKFYKVIPIDVVPVVYGGGDYKSVLPHDSYIDVSNFTSVYKLAQYLLHVGGSFPDYFNYIKAKKGYQVEDKLARPWCKLCKMVKLVKERRSRFQNRVYDRLYSWYYNRHKCLNLFNGGLNRTYIDELYQYPS
ncbi:FUT4 (predicted) [Pycnogonum litorale]